jgi:chromosome segregation ATPase
MDVKQNAYIEAKKIADSLAQDCADFRQQAESEAKEASDLRKSLAVAQTQNNSMKAEMMSLHEDIRTFKSQSEFTIISREDEMAALQQQVDHLTKQLDIKDEIVRNAARDVQELRKIRTAQDLERERLEAQVETQAFQLDQANSEILKTKQDVTDFDRRYRDVATALSVSQARRMSSEPAETPDIQPIETPAPEAEFHQPAEKSVDDFENLSADEISDRVMDFRLGLRSDLT